MNEKIIALVLALMSACVPANEGLTEPEEPAEPEVIVEHYQVNGIYTTYVEETDYTYYTVYAWNYDTGRTECIADDFSVEAAESEPWIVTMYQKLILVYKADMPHYSGVLYPVDKFDWE